MTDAIERTRELPPRLAQREPYTDHFCIMCMRDLAHAHRYRVVLLVNGGRYAQRADLWGSANPDDPGFMGVFKIGLNCARRLGLEFSKTPAQEAKFAASKLA